MEQKFERHLSDGLDYYKLTMGQVALEKHPDAEVTFTLKNRGYDHPLSQHVRVEELQGRLDAVREQGVTLEEIAYFAGLQAQDGTARFDEEYLDFLANVELSSVTVALNVETNDLDVNTTGNWANVSLWETVVMSEVNELYYKNYMTEHGLDEAEVWKVGDNRLSDKINTLKEHPDIRFADFGTRRRFSAKWHDHAVDRLSSELPENFVGTSNPWFAYKYQLAPIGTYAHEMPMVYAAEAENNGGNPLQGHHTMLEDWDTRYNGDLSIALTDTFTSEFFFQDFTKQQAEKWNGLRHDSGDPVEFGEQAIEFYKNNGIDPLTKTVVFSDGLDLDKIIELNDHFKDKIRVLFGWGTTLMNDMGIRANNFVMKATNVDGTETVKLSDNQGKHTGSQEKVDQYIRLVEARKAVNDAVTPMVLA
jgi:nicotinate phosphoribosyltransferase